MMETTVHRPALVAVDDAPLVLELLVDLLESKGYTLPPARDGEQAWSILKAQARVDHAADTDIH